MRARHTVVIKLKHAAPPSSYNGMAGADRAGHTFPVSAIALKYANPSRGEALQSMNTVDKIAGLKEILALDPKNSFARYGIAVELASRGEIDAAIAEFDKLLELDIDYTAGYFMAAQTLVRAERSDDAKQMLQDGIASARRTGNLHAQSEMEAMLAELQ
jgi:tetratricopeptide (TPR) repeat protein